MTTQDSTMVQRRGYKMGTQSGKITLELDFQCKIFLVNFQSSPDQEHRKHRDMNITYQSRMKKKTKKAKILSLL